jgi:hypothetical protein
MAAGGTRSIASSRPTAASTILSGPRSTHKNGYTIGHWEGDTLVLDSIGFTDATWAG